MSRPKVPLLGSLPENSVTRTTNQRVACARAPLFAFSLSAVVFGAACSQAPQGESGPETSRMAISNASATILGFEESSSWSVSNGTATLASDATHSEGTASLAVSNVGYVELTSAPLASFPLSDGAISVDLMLPKDQTNPYWYGQLQVSLDCPSANIHGRFIGSSELTGLPLATFNRLSFVLSSDVVSAMSGTHNDLRFKIVLNVPQNSAKYLLDSVRLNAKDDGSNTGGSDSITSPPVQSMSLDIKVPAMVAVTDMALTANGALFMGDRAKVASTTGKVVPVANIGAQSSSIANGVTTGNTWIAHDLSLALAGKIDGSLQIGGNLSNQDSKNTNILHGITSGPVALQTNSRGVAFPTVLGLPILLEPDKTKTIDPAAVASISVKNRSKLTLTAGNYFTDTLLVDQDAWLYLDMSKGPISIYVRSSVDFKGQVKVVSGTPDQFLIGYWGTQDVLFQGPMTGAVLAPNAKLTFGRTSTPHRGSFFAKNIEVQADAQIVFIPYSGWLIEQVTLDKTEVCVNEPVKVSVKTNSAIAAQSVVYTTINGLPGTQQLLQFQGAPGIRLINVVVDAPASKVRSSQFATVTVKDCGSSVKFPRLAFAANPYHPNTADMRLTNAADLGIQTASY